MFTKIKSLAAILLFLSVPSAVYAGKNDASQSQGMPPAKVVVAKILTGTVAPENEFIGTAYYQEKSGVASELGGKVELVNFKEGDRVKKGDVLVQLNTDLLEKKLLAAYASYEEVLAALEEAQKKFERADKLYKEELISDEIHDSSRFSVKSIEKKALSLKADADILSIELEKTAIRAPYDGLVVKKNTDRGEWLSSGSTAMTIAKDDYMVPVVYVPERIVQFIRAGQLVDVKVGKLIMKGKVVAIVPAGDTSTRTFPVKIGIPNDSELIEGMEVRVTLPAGKRQKALTVPRDAVITAYGNTVVYAVNDSKAAMIPVKIIGYNGMTAGIQGQGLAEGMNVVIKGNERLRPGQPVMIQK